MDPADLDLAYHDVFSWSGLADGQRKRAWQGKSRKSTVEHGKGLHIPRLTEVDVPPGCSSTPPRGPPALRVFFCLQVFLGLVQDTNLIQRLINVAYTYDNLAHRYRPGSQAPPGSPGPPLTASLLVHRVLKAQSDHRSRHEGANIAAV